VGATLDPNIITTFGRTYRVRRWGMVATPAADADLTVTLVDEAGTQITGTGTLTFTGGTTAAVKNSGNLDSANFTKLAAKLVNASAAGTATIFSWWLELVDMT